MLGLVSDAERWRAGAPGGVAGTGDSEVAAPERDPEGGRFPMLDSDGPHQVGRLSQRSRRLIRQVPFAALRNAPESLTLCSLIPVIARRSNGYRLHRYSSSRTLALRIMIL